MVKRASASMVRGKVGKAASMGRGKAALMGRGKALMKRGKAALMGRGQERGQERGKAAPMKRGKAAPMKRGKAAPRRQRGETGVRPTFKRTLRALGGRRVVIEGFGPSAPALVVIAAGVQLPIGAWLAPAELRRFVEVAKRILR